MTGSETPEPYRVLARKYRPTTFSGLIGQDAMVRTLSNAFDSGRLAHAFILTGVRGVGKTTTARIIARAMNCIGPDGDGGPTTEPCGVCAHCTAIAEDRHVDVLEMDAASRTGVDDIRELIDGVRYRPTSARYKVYIVDEVHMLSKNAFNALLKTLEEPPAHVKFIFATTEIRKVPVTVLSRCQRFDLNRIDIEMLADHFATITGKEGAEIDDAALHLIARAAEGSVRDGLSLLDQAISQAQGKITADQVREMLGLADRGRSFDLLEAVMAGDAAAALDGFEQQYRDGADPAMVLEDLLEISHWLTRIKVVPAAADDPRAPEVERLRGKDMEARLSMAALSRAWQMLFKGLAEVRAAPSPRQAAEMVLVRLAYTSTLPTPEEALKALPKTDAQPTAAAATTPPNPAPGPVVAIAETATGSAAPAMQRRAELAPTSEPLGEAAPVIATFDEVLALVAERREAVLLTHLERDLRLVRFEPGRIEFNPSAEAPADLANRLSGFLNQATESRWIVSVSAEPGRQTRLEQRATAEQALKSEMADQPLVKAVMETFPGATITNIREIADDPEEPSD